MLNMQKEIKLDEAMTVTVIHSPEPTQWYSRETSIGRVSIVEQHGSLTALSFEGEEVPVAGTPGLTPLLDEAFRQLDAWLAGEVTGFSLPLAPQGTGFMMAVWLALQEIPYGSTCTYREIAARIGSPEAVRAVGTACGRNPLPIFIPCHRVVRTDGGLGGYRGGKSLKHALLGLEQGRGLRQESDD